MRLELRGAQLAQQRGRHFDDSNGLRDNAHCFPIPRFSAKKAFFADDVASPDDVAYTEAAFAGKTNLQSPVEDEVNMSDLSFLLVDILAMLQRNQF